MTERQLSSEARSAFIGVLLNKNLRSLRSEYCRTVTDQLSTVAGWLGFDSLLGGGDTPQMGLDDSTSESTPARYAAFRGVSAVVEMAAELGAGSVSLLDEGLRYATAALVRQLIEAEYLLRAFEDDIARAAEWCRSSSLEIRRSFLPKTMRPLGGFSDLEYWTHCDHGGHPSPQGRHLLRSGILLRSADEEVLIASSWGDLAQHLRRIWTATRSLLGTHHARFTSVRVAEIEIVRNIEDRWAAEDPLAAPIDFALLNGVVQSEEARQPTDACDGPVQ